MGPYRNKETKSKRTGMWKEWYPWISSIVSHNALFSFPNRKEVFTMKKLLCSVLLVCLLCAMSISAFAADWPEFYFELSADATAVDIDTSCQSLRTGTGDWRVKVNTADPGQAQGRGVFFNCYRTANLVKFGNGIWVADKTAHNGSWSRTPVSDLLYSPAARADNLVPGYEVSVEGFFDAQQLGTTRSGELTWW